MRTGHLSVLRRGAAELLNLATYSRGEEEALLSEALSRADGHQGVAAALLGLSRQALNKRLHRRQPSGRTAEPAE